MTLRALQICPNDHPPFVTVCRGFEAALQQLGYAVTTVFFASTGLDAPAERRYLAPRALPRLAAAGAFDAVLTHRYKGYRAGLAVPSRAQVSLAHGFGMFRRRRRRLRRRLARKAVTFAGVSTAVAEDLARDLKRRCPTLPNPLALEPLQASLLDRHAARHALGLDANAYAVGVIGRLHGWKRPMLAVEGFRRAQAALGADARLVFVGAGALESAIPQGPAITLTGFVQEAHRYLRAFDVVLSTSTHREAFGMSLVEALAAGVAVVCADQPGPREATGGCARFFVGDDADALADALIATRREGFSPLPGYRHVAENLSVAAAAQRLEALLARR